MPIHHSGLASILAYGIYLAFVKDVR